MGQVDFLYWKLAIGICILGILFLFATTESLVRGHFRIPAFVFSSFTMVLGVIFLNVFLDSLAEFSVGRHDSIDDMLRVCRLIGSIFFPYA